MIVHHRQDTCKDRYTDVDTKFWSIIFECTRHCDVRLAGKYVGWILGCDKNTPLASCDRLLKKAS